MTTTVTSNLNLAKPDIGSEANNWGNVLNGTIDQIDKAIAQRLVKGVGGGSSVTLSDSESSFAIIEFQGTLSGNIDVKTASNDTKPYIIFNNTSGSYNLTFKSNSGTGVVITQGLKSIVYGDGSNIVEATSPANSFSANKTITLSGVVSGSVATDFSSDPTITTSIVDGSIVNADINTSAAIDASKIADGSVSNTEFQRLDGVTSDIQTQINNKIDGSSLNANNLSSGTVPNARYGTPTFNGSNLTSLNASNLSSGTVPSARLPSLGLSGGEFFTTNSNWTCPAGVTTIFAIITGGGGGAGGQGTRYTTYNYDTRSGRGGEGGHFEGLISVTPGTTYSIVIGVGGDCGDNYAFTFSPIRSGFAGGDTTAFGITATGGGGGSGSFTGQTGGNPNASGVTGTHGTASGTALLTLRNLHRSYGAFAMQGLMQPQSGTQSYTIAGISPHVVTGPSDVYAAGMGGEQGSNVNIAANNIKSGTGGNSGMVQIFF